MEGSSSPPPSPLVFLLILVCFAAAATEAAARHGFLHTRNRGRCTPQFWSSRRETWPRMVPQGSTVSKVFYIYDLTLLEPTARNDDGENVFARLVKSRKSAGNQFASQWRLASWGERKSKWMQRPLVEKKPYSLSLLDMLYDQTT